MTLVQRNKSCKIDRDIFHLSFLVSKILLSFLILQLGSLDTAYSFSVTSSPTTTVTDCCRGRSPKATTTVTSTIHSKNRVWYQSTQSYFKTASNDNEVNINKKTSLIASIASITTSPTKSKYFNMSIKAIGSTTTIVVSGLFFVVLAYKRNAIMISFFIGAIMNGILSKVLKKLIQQTRPVELYQPPTSSSTSTTARPMEVPQDHGMPSSHAMSLGFISTFIVCNIMSLQIPLLLYTVASLYYRVQVKLHTYQQVLVGSILGSTNGFLWYRLCTGNNPFNIHIMNLVKKYLFNNQEQLPIPYLIVPLLVGAATIGSFERRISALLRKKKKEV